MRVRYITLLLAITACASEETTATMNPALTDYCACSWQTWTECNPQTGTECRPVTDWVCPSIGTRCDIARPDGTPHSEGGSCDGQGVCVRNNCTRTPSYQIQSIIYAPPGKSSTVSYSTAKSVGNSVQSSSSTSFSDGYASSFNLGIPVPFTSGTVTVGAQTSDSSGFATTFVYGRGQSLTSTVARGIDVGLFNGTDEANHDNDQFSLWRDAALVECTTLTGDRFQFWDTLVDGSTPKDVVAYSARALREDTTDYYLNTKLSRDDRIAILQADPFSAIPDKGDPLPHKSPAQKIIGNPRFKLVDSRSGSCPYGAFCGRHTASDPIFTFPLTVTDSVSNDSSYGTSSATTAGWSQGWSISTPVFSIGNSYTRTVTSVYSDTRTTVIGDSKSASLALRMDAINRREDVDVYLDTSFGTFLTLEKNFRTWDCEAFQSPLLVNGIQQCACDPATGSHLAAPWQPGVTCACDYQAQGKTLENDDANCGACGRTCGGGTVCRRGTCECPPLQTSYNGSCVADTTLGWLDAMTYANGAVHVQGWVVATTPGQTAKADVAVRVYDASGKLVAKLWLDPVHGANVPYSATHQSRPDVKSYWDVRGYPNNDFTNSGFDATVALPSLPPGSYSVAVGISTRNGLSGETNRTSYCTTSDACPSGQVCNASNTCSSVGCDATHPCNDGCCSGGVCQPGTSTNACGPEGSTCSVCGSTQSCTSSTCMDPEPAFDCSSCACGCTGTSCTAPVRCSAYACRKAGGYCDPCGGCVVD